MARPPRRSTRERAGTPPTLAEVWATIERIVDSAQRAQILPPELARSPDLARLVALRGWERGIMPVTALEAYIPQWDPREARWRIVRRTDVAAAEAADTREAFQTPSGTDRPLTFDAGMTNENPPQPLRTHGVTRETLVALVSLSRPGEGAARWQDAQAVIVDELRALGIDPTASGALRHVTESEGLRILAMVRERLGLTNGKAAAEPTVPAPAPTRPSRRRYETLEAVMAEHGAEALRPEIEEFLCRTHKVDRLADISADDLARALPDLPPFIESPPTLRLVLERLRMEG